MGRLQNEDIKSSSELIIAGGTKSQLPNDSKVYISSFGRDKTLEEVLLQRLLGGSPLKIHANSTPDSKLYIEPSVVDTLEGVAQAASPLKSQVLTIVSSTIDFQTGVTTGATFSLTFPASTVGQFRTLGLTLLSSGTIQGIFTPEAATVGALANPGTTIVKGGLPLGYITLECTNITGRFKTAGSATNIIENVTASTYRIFTFGSGGSGSSSASSGSGGGELADLSFNAAIRDSFSDSLDGSTPTDIGTRKTDATLLDVANELIRLNYDATKTVTGSAITNLFYRSEEFDNASWTKTNCSVTSNAVNAPNGTLTADKLVEDGTLNSHNITQTVQPAGFVTATVYTFSVFAKAAERTQLRMTLPGVLFSTAPSVYFDLVAGTVLSNTGATAFIEDFGNGWFRASITATSTGSGTNAATLYPALGGTSSYTGNGSSGIYIWGAQVEVGQLSGYVQSVATSGSANHIMTLSATPGFTIKAGDMIIVNSEARKIVSVPTQTTPTIESAFTTNPSVTACCISQALHTEDLNTFNNSGLGLSVASQYSGNIDEILLGYQDSETLNDIIPDFGSTASIAYSASTDETSWTTSRVRINSLSSMENSVTCPTSNPNLFLRFFANKTSGTGAVNLLSYKVFFHKVFGQTVGGTYYTAFARPTAGIFQNCTHSVVNGKSRFTFNFSYTRGLNSGESSGSVLESIIDGKIIPRLVAGVTDLTQAYANEIADNIVEFDRDYSLDNFDFQFKVQRVGIIDTNTNNVTKIALHDDLLDQSLDAQIVPTFLSAVNGSPSTSQFRSDITNRASIPDLSNMLAVQMGPQRMMTQEVYQLQSEFGPAGQQVFGVVNDKFNQIRFVGAWVNVNSDNGQAAMSSASLTDYVEIVFYGTGLNLINLMSSSQRDMRVSIDGGSESANFYPASGSSILNARNYSSNIIMNVASGLSLGFHTVKIRNNSASNLPIVFGFEVLTETTSLRVTSGTVMKGKYKNSLSALQTVAFDSSFESGTLGTRGGCVLVYLKNDGTIGKAVTPTDATALYLTSADHTNEEVIRTHSFREFAAGRTSDDFSSNANTTRAFTLDDGVTTLVGLNILTQGGANPETIELSTSGQVTFTFVGTGCDVVRQDGDNGGTHTLEYFVDGVSRGTEVVASSARASRTYKVCSGLPYGTHTVRVQRNAAVSFNPGLSRFVVYAPKKPALPSGAIELAQYYNMATYVASASSAQNIIATGVLRKTLAIRETLVVGTWTVPGLSPTNFDCGYNISSSSSGAYGEYRFFGTGFEWKGFATTVTATNQTITVDGSSNLSGFTTSFSQEGSGISFTASTGVIAGTSGTNQKLVIRVSGLTLGFHTIRVTSNNANTNYIDSIDIICPIHAPALNGPYIVQNTLALGNNNFLDLRKFNKKDITSVQYPMSQTKGLASTTTNASTTFVPVPDMSTMIRVVRNKIRISYNATFSNTLSAASDNQFQIFVDGVAVGVDQNQAAGTINNSQHISDYLVVNVQSGFHKIDVYAKVNGGSLQFLGSRRVLTVEEIGDI